MKWKKIKLKHVIVMKHVLVVVKKEKNVLARMKNVIVDATGNASAMKTANVDVMIKTKNVTVNNIKERILRFFILCCMLL